METSLLLGLVLGLAVIAHSRIRGPSLKDLPVDPALPEEPLPAASAAPSPQTDVLARGRCMCNAVDALVLFCIGCMIAGVAWQKDFHGSIEHVLQLVEAHLPRETALIRKLLL